MTYHPQSAAITPRTTTTPRARLFDEVRRRLRLKHDSLSTERIYLQWMRRFILASGRRHPRDMGGAKVERSLSALGNLRGRFIFSEYSCRRRVRAPVCSGPRKRGRRNYLFESVASCFSDCPVLNLQSGDPAESAVIRHQRGTDVRGVRSNQQVERSE